MDIKKIISEMTLEEKASMCSGQDFWHTQAVERLGIPAIMVSDGPHGLRKQDEGGDNLGVNDSIKAVCFPAACATSSSFDRELLAKMGAALGDECQHEGVAVLLGPAVNIKRSPLCGRNFEYVSEDPYLASQMAGSLIKGVQSKKVGTSIKHFAVNNQEYRRMTTDSQVDERAFREIYLAAFEGAIKEGEPWTVMCSYNKINGVYGSENKTTLTDILRDEWGFDGLVMSDWGAVNDRVAGVAAGLDLEMPPSFGENDKLVLEAVKSGKLPEEVLDRLVERILKLVEKYESSKAPDTAWDMDADHELARETEAECAVLLKNEDRILPIPNDGTIAFIGKYAKKPRFQGGGSSHINCHKTESALEAAADPKYGIKAKIIYAQGYDDKDDVVDEGMIAEAVQAAMKADKAVIFAGLPDSFESEGYDRKHMSMPGCQLKLIDEVVKVQPNTVVVLHNGSPMEMPWLDKVPGVLEMYLGGQAVGGATIELLFGRKNPSGHLAETFPLKYEDNPSYLFFPGKKDVAEYREGIYVGYRYYDKKNMPVMFPFGFGLSYTEFEYHDMRLSSKSFTEGEELTVTATVKNIGKVRGKAVAQLYVRAPQDGTDRAIRELKGFVKTELNPGESKTVSFTIDSRAFALWDTEVHKWVVEDGEYVIEIGESSRDIKASAAVAVAGTGKRPVRFSYTTPMADIFRFPECKALVEPLLEGYILGSDADGESAAEAISTEMQEAMLADLPLKALLSFGGGKVTNQMLWDVVDAMNALEIEA